MALMVDFMPIFVTVNVQKGRQRFVFSHCCQWFEYRCRLCRRRSICPFGTLVDGVTSKLEWAQRDPCVFGSHLCCQSAPDRLLLSLNQQPVVRWDIPARTLVILLAEVFSDLGRGELTMSFFFFFLHTEQIRLSAACPVSSLVIQINFFLHCFPRAGGKKRT